MTLKFRNEDHGNCRVYFTRASKGGVRMLYCWQKADAYSYEFLACSRDGEPSHVVKGWTDTATNPLQETPTFKPETDTGRELLAYIDRMQTEAADLAYFSKIMGG